MKRLLLILAFALFIISLSSFADAEWRNMSDGFSTVPYGFGGPQGITSNGSDFWITNYWNSFVYHVKPDGNGAATNYSDGFSVLGIGSFRPHSITTNGSDFWIVNGLDGGDYFVYHVNKSGYNFSDGFSTLPFGSDRPFGITTNVSGGIPTDFWITDFGDDFVYHVSSAGVNKSDGFSVRTFGLDTPYAIANNLSDFWLGDRDDAFIYHIKPNGIGGATNYSDGFSMKPFGSSQIHSLAVLSPVIGAPDEFWVIDKDDIFVYHISNTGPRISGLMPGESQTEGTVTISARTDVDATCRYATQNLAYSDMTQQFSTTGSKTHSTAFTPTECITSLYVACIDINGNKNRNATGFSFSLIGQNCWSRFMNTLDVLGVSQSTVPTAQPIEAWNFKTDGSVRSSPVVVNNILYIGATDGTFYAINANTGEEIWRRYFESSPHWPTIPITELDGTAAVEDGIVYITTGTNESLYALDAATGSYKWHHFNGDYSISSPLIYGDKIFYTSRNYYLYALDKNTGSVLWAYNTGWRSQSSPSVYNGVVYAATRNGNLLHAVNESTGQKIWNFTEGGWNAYGSSTVSNGIIYIGSASYNFYAINSTNGLEIWRYATGGEIATTASVYNGRVYISSYDNQLYAFDAVGGSKLWNYTIPATKSWLDSSPIVSRGVVLIGGGDRQFYAINATNGNKLWNYTVGANITSTPALVNGYIYFGTNTPDNTTYALKSAINIPPTVSLNSPSDGYVSPSKKVSFSCTGFDDDDDEISNVSLYGNWYGSWHRAATNTSAKKSVANAFDVTISNWQSQPDGISTLSYGSAQLNGFTTNGTDFWILDYNDDFVYHLNSTHDNQTDGFSTAAFGSDNPEEMTTNGTDFWILDAGWRDNFVYHVNRSGYNFSDGFSLATATGASSSTIGITTNASGGPAKDFWISDDLDDFVYHIRLNGDGTITNLSDGFSTAAFGSTGPKGVWTNGSDLWVVDRQWDYFVYHVKPNGDGTATNFSDGFSTWAFGSGWPLGITSNKIDGTPGVPTEFYIGDDADFYVYHLKSFSENQFIWNCQACDISGSCAFSSSNRSLTIEEPTTPIAGYIPRWRYVAVTYSSTTKQKKIYVDGSLVRTDTLSGLGNYKINNPAGNLYISKHPTMAGISFNGTVDELGIYSKAMSDNEITSGLMASTLYTAMPIQNEEKTFVLNAENVTEVTVSPIVKIGNKEKNCGITAKIKIPPCS